MMDKERLRSETAHYRLLADQLKKEFGELDDETLTDTLQGLSDLPEMIEEIVRSGLDDEALMAALKARLDEMKSRFARLKNRFERKRELVSWAMGSSGIAKLQAADFSVALCAGAQRLDVTDESKIPEFYFVPQPAKLDRTSLLNAVKRGEPIEGANLVAGQPYIAVSTR